MPLQDRTLRGIYLLFLLIFVIAGLASLAAVRTVNRARVSSDWVNQTHGTIYELNSLLAGLQQGEGLLRTYALTRDARDLAEARAVFEEAREHAEVAKAQMRSDADFTRTLGQLDGTLQARLAFSAELERVVAGGEVEPVAALLRRDAGAGVAREFERTVIRLRDRQFELLSAQDHDSFLQAQTTRWIVGLGIGLNFLLFAGVAWLIRDALRTRRQLTETLQQANLVLEQKVKERTAELTASNQRLTSENRARKWTSASQEHQLRYNDVIIGTISDVVFVLSKVLSIGRLNPAAVRASGRREEAMLGRPVGNFVRLTGEAPGLDPLARAMQEGRELADLPAELLTAQGTARPGRLTLVPLHDNNKVVGGVLVFRLSPNA